MLKTKLCCELDQSFENALLKNLDIAGLIFNKQTVIQCEFFITSVILSSCFADVLFPRYVCGCMNHCVGSGLVCMHVIEQHTFYADNLVALGHKSHTFPYQRKHYFHHQVQL